MIALVRLPRRSGRQAAVDAGKLGKRLDHWRQVKARDALASPAGKRHIPAAQTCAGRLCPRDLAEFAGEAKRGR